MRTSSRRIASRSSQLNWGAVRISGGRCLASSAESESLLSRRPLGGGKRVSTSTHRQPSAWSNLAPRRWASTKLCQESSSWCANASCSRGEPPRTPSSGATTRSRCHAKLKSPRRRGAVWAPEPPAFLRAPRVSGRVGGPMGRGPSGWSACAPPVAVRRSRCHAAPIVFGGAPFASAGGAGGAGAYECGQPGGRCSSRSSSVYECIQLLTLPGPSFQLLTVPASRPK